MLVIWDLRALKKEHYYNLIFALIIVLFLVTRFFGLDQIYHQDEYRWATIVDPAFEENTAPHPPINKISLSVVGAIFGFDNLRISPLIFSFLTLLLLYAVVLKITGSKMIGHIAAGLFTINIYSLIASLQIDIDGAILPFFILLSYYGYLNLLENQKSKKHWAFFLAGIIGGFLSKLSFVLFVAALIIDFALRSGLNWRKAVKILPIPASLSVVLIAIFYVFFREQSQIIANYALHFKSLNFASRAYFDLSFKLLKSVVWLSPLLLFPVLYGLFKKDVLRKHSIWFVYLGINLVFYLVLFDFSTLTAERYFMFLIVPSVMISGAVIHGLLKDIKWKENMIEFAFVSALFAGLSFFILSRAHKVLPLNPKTGFIDSLKSFDLNFLIPFTGGSGPAGFYHSASFIFWTFIISALSFCIAILIKKGYAMRFALVFVAVGLVFNVFLSAEYLFGIVFGSVPKVTKETLEYIINDKKIDRVITYYNSGAYYLRKSGQYSGRFYTAETRDYTKKISVYSGYYMIVDFPSIDKNGRYWPLIERCENIRTFEDKYIKSHIIDCANKK